VVLDYKRYAPIRPVLSDDKKNSIGRIQFFFALGWFFPKLHPRKAEKLDTSILASEVQFSLVHSLNKCC